MKYQQWNIAQRSQEAYKAMERQGVPTLVAATLCARGMTDLAEAKGLLSSGEDQLQDPFLMKDMDLATARIGRALRNGEKIAVYGDYDVDGITSTCLLTHYLRAQGGDVCYYIPNRLSEGYGVNREAVEELARQGVRLMITVDCGITAVEEEVNGVSVPDSFQAFIGRPSNSSYQVMLLWRTKPTGQLTLTKSSANPALTDGNSCYSLAGAEYTVKDSSGTEVGTLKVDADGAANTLTVNAGPYTAQETVAPKGYALDPTVYRVNVTSGQTTTLRVTDLPQSDPVGVLLRKVDATSGDGETC